MTLPTARTRDDTNTVSAPGISTDRVAPLLAAGGLLVFMAMVAISLTIGNAAPLPPTCGALEVRRAIAEQLDGLSVAAWRDIRVTGSDLDYGHRLCRATVVVADGQHHRVRYALRRDATGKWGAQVLVDRAP